MFTPLSQRSLFCWLSYAAFVAFAVLLVLGVLWVGSLPALAKPKPIWRWVTWLSAAPILVAMLAANWAYHWLVRGHGETAPSVGLTPLLWLACCVSPAIVEEYFYRYLALNSARQCLGTHSAVWLTSLMFATGHLHSPISMPFFLIAGATYGYVRILSGGLLLPILMHLLHNTAVFCIDFL